MTLFPELAAPAHLITGTHGTAWEGTPAPLLKADDGTDKWADSRILRFAVLLPHLMGQHVPDLDDAPFSGLVIVTGINLAAVKHNAEPRVAAAMKDYVLNIWHAPIGAVQTDPETWGEYQDDPLLAIDLRGNPAVLPTHLSLLVQDLVNGQLDPVHMDEDQPVPHNLPHWSAYWTDLETRAQALIQEMPMTQPATHDAQEARHLTSLHDLYPAARWWMKYGEEGDFSGPAETPQAALDKAREDLGENLPGILSDNAGDVTIGFWTEDAILLRHTHQLVQAGLPLSKAERMTADLNDRLSAALTAAHGEEAWFGWTPIYNVSTTGELSEIQ